MIYGLYLSAQGAEAQAARLDVVANNLANAATSSFKRDLALFQSHRPFDVEHGHVGAAPFGLDQATGGISLADIVTDFSNGALAETGGTYDLALAGPGFFRVANGDQQFLTRDGRLAKNELGELMLQDTDFRLLSIDGAPVQVPDDATEIEITGDGRMVRIDNGFRTVFDQIAVVQPESLQNLEKVGDNFYRGGGALRPAGPEVRIRQGYVEASGTNSVAETMQMIEATRGFETNINMIRFQDEALGRLLQAAKA